MFPPGRARLATNPWPTGSPVAAKTIGIEVVASLATRADPQIRSLVLYQQLRS